MVERIVEVMDDRETGETILDEALRMTKAQEEVERMGANVWIDLMSGRFQRGRALAVPLFLVPHSRRHQHQLTSPSYQAKYGTSSK